MNSKSTPLHKFLTMISWVILICGLGFLILFWNYIPNELPLHSTGMRLEDIDRYGDKLGLIPIILAFILIYLLLCLIPYFPSEFNMSNDIKDNEKKIINNLTKTKWLILRIEYLIFIIYFTLRIITIQGIGNFIYFFMSICTCTVIFFDFKIGKFK